MLEGLLTVLAVAVLEVKVNSELVVETLACSTSAAEGDTLVSLRVSGSARRANSPLAKLAAAISAALKGLEVSSPSTSFNKFLRDSGVVAVVPMVSARECFLETDVIKPSVSS